jgi:hypothetical protein
VTSLCVRNLIARCRRATAIVKTSLKIHQKFISDVRFHYLVPNKSRLKRVIFPDRCRRKVQVHAFSIGFRSALTSAFYDRFLDQGTRFRPFRFPRPRSAPLQLSAKQTNTSCVRSCFVIGIWLACLLFFG